MALKDQHEALTQLREYLMSAGGPDSHLSPVWLARRLGIDEWELLGAPAYAIREGLVEMHWEVYCPGCGISVHRLRQ